MKFSSRGEGVLRKKRFRVHCRMNVEIPTTRGINFHRNICHRLDDVADQPTLRSKYRYLDYRKHSFCPGGMQKYNGQIFKRGSQEYQAPAKLSVFRLFEIEKKLHEYTSSSDKTCLERIRSGS